MGAWGHGLLDNDTTLDFVDDTAERLQGRLTSTTFMPMYSDFYNAAIFIHGIKAAMEDGPRQNALGGKHRRLPSSVHALCRAFVRQFTVALRDEPEDFMAVLYRQLDMVQGLLDADAEAEQASDLARGSVADALLAGTSFEAGLNSE